MFLRLSVVKIILKYANYKNAHSVKLLNDRTIRILYLTFVSVYTVVVLTNGSKYEGTIRPVEYALGDRIIKYGCAGEDVKLIQEMLL